MRFIQLAKVLRYTFPTQRGLHKIKIPKEHRIVFVGVKPRHRDFISAWALVEEMKNEIEKEFLCVETNEDFDSSKWSYLTTILRPHQEYALHVFEKREK